MKNQGGPIALVTGGAGFIGERLVSKLLEDGMIVRVLDLVRPAYDEDLDDGNGPERSLTCVRGDVRDLGDVIGAMGESDIVYHLAGPVAEMVKQDVAGAMQVQTQGTLNILEAARRGTKAPKIVLASSFYVYDGLPAELPVDEKSQLNVFGMDPFATAKLVSERLVQVYAEEYGLDYVTLRFGSAYGADERCSNVVYGFAKAALAGDALVIWGSGERRNQYVHVNDLVTGIVGAGAAVTGMTLNLISEEETTTNELARMLVQQVGKASSRTSDIQRLEDKPEGPSMPFMSSRRAQRALRWNPDPMVLGIARLVADLRLERVGA